MSPARRTPTSARAERARLAAPVFAAHDGVARRSDLLDVGITRDDVRAEIAAGRWRSAGWHTVAQGTAPPRVAARLWQAVWESGSGAVLDGAAALCAFGLQGFVPEVVDVSVPAGTHPRVVAGVRVRRTRRPAPAYPGGIPRVRVEWAVVHAAQWATTDRTAALLVCLPIQQRLCRPDRLRTTWQAISRSPRRALLDQVIGDVCDGAHSLGELEFGLLCRRYGLPSPTRQAVCRGPAGRVYLDVELTDIGLVVEIDGGHHYAALTPVADALRQNEVTIGARIVVRIPVLGLRLTPELFMEQVVRAYRVARSRVA